MIELALLIGVILFFCDKPKVQVKEIAYSQRDINTVMHGTMASVYYNQHHGQ